MSVVKWNLDPHHSEIFFKVKHLMITTVTGSFTNFKVDVETDGDDFLKVNKILFIAEANSINTNNENRDNHLRSADFFDSVTYPEIIFSSNGFSLKENHTVLTGDLTIKGITRPVEIQVEFGGITIDMQGQVKAGFSIQGKLNRREFGLVWGSVTEAGHVIVSDEVKFQGEIQLIKQVDA